MAKHDPKEAKDTSLSSIASTMPQGSQGGDSGESEVTESGIPKAIADEVKDKRHWIYKRDGAKFWRSDKPGQAKPVVMRNASHTWDGSEEEFKDQFERE